MDTKKCSRRTLEKGERLYWKEQVGNPGGQKCLQRYRLEEFNIILSYNRSISYLIGEEI
jgi:hypothetical protein